MKPKFAPFVMVRYKSGMFLYVIVREGVKFGINFSSCSDNGYEITRSTKNGKTAQLSGGRNRVQDIGVWLQCFAVFVGMVAKSSPEAVPGLMAYVSASSEQAKNMRGRHGQRTMRPSGGKPLRLGKVIGEI